VYLPFSSATEAARNSLSLELLWQPSSQLVYSLNSFSDADSALSPANQKFAKLFFALFVFVMSF
jgi:hypothetical protein